MNLRTPLILLAAAAIGAAALTALHSDEPLEERVTRIETRKTFPAFADELAQHPPAVRLVMLDYAGDEELVLNARLALLRHPHKTPRLLALYGPSEAFRDILREHGPAIVPPVHYFLEHDLLSVRLYSLLADPPDSSRDNDDELQTVADGYELEPIPPETRGWYAIAFIREEGHDFLGQFVTGDDGSVHWVQTERFATGAKRLFTSGLTTLEMKWRRGDDLEAGDWGWATVDVMIPVVAFKLARAGKLAGHSARSAGTSARMARAGAGTARLGRTLAIAGSAAGIGYIAMNPGVLNSIGGQIATTLGLPAWAINGVIWFIVLLPLLILLRIGQRWLLRPFFRFLMFTAALMARIRRRLYPDIPVGREPGGPPP